MAQHVGGAEVGLVVEGMRRRHRELVVHLVECRMCRQKVGEWSDRQLEGLRGLESDRGSVAGASPAKYDEVFTRVAERVAAEPPAGAATAIAAGCLEELLELPDAAGRRRYVAARPECHGRRFVELLLAKALSGGETSIELAQLGVEIAREAELGPEELALETLTRAWAVYGYVLNEAELRAESDQAFQAAREHATQGFGTPAEAVYCGYLGRARFRRWEAPEAAALLARSAELYGVAERFEEEVDEFVVLAEVAFQAGDLEKAANVLGEALLVLGDEHERAGRIRWLLVWLLLVDGRHQDSIAVLAEASRAKGQPFGDALRDVVTANLLRRALLEGGPRAENELRASLSGARGEGRWFEGAVAVLVLSTRFIGTEQEPPGWLAGELEDLLGQAGEKIPAGVREVLEQVARAIRAGHLEQRLLFVAASALAELDPEEENGDGAEQVVDERGEVS